VGLKEKILKKIVLTGGGSAGHVTPNIALINRLRVEGWQAEYIGSRDGIEKQLIKGINIPYHEISSGKLRRYLSAENLVDPFKVLLGIIQAFFLVKKIKPQIVFSKGGFVTVPVIIAAYLTKIPVIIHESDMTPGLANKIAIPFARKVCVSFPETLKNLPSEKGIYTGAPIREELLTGDRQKGLKFCRFSSDKPVLLVIGGSLGSEKINKSLREILDYLLIEFQIVHVCGKGNVDNSINAEGYRQFEYISQELPDVFAMTDLVLSRSGSNAVFEFLALKKPNLLIPLSKKASRGDQILNAESFKKSGYSMVLEEEEVNSETLYNALKQLNKNKENYISRMKENPNKDSVKEILGLITEYSLK
jgi:UDP-N-acetylglucosamine--N-acetylmuramyl-(pentapeptide) pyrophosphoryl-undecaprenol N-acetylglucosamine transferase